MSKIPITKDSSYILPNGKELTREDALLIGYEAGLNTRPTSDNDYDYLEAEMISDANGGSYLVHHNPVYRPYVYEKEPLPPMLVFLCSSIHDIQGNVNMSSSYTINLKTLKPTAKSMIQNAIPEYIRSRYM